MHIVAKVNAILPLSFFTALNIGAEIFTRCKHGLSSAVTSLDRRVLVFVISYGRITEVFGDTVNVVIGYNLMADTTFSMK